MTAFDDISPCESQAFDWLFNQNTLDSLFDAAIEDMSRVDKELWEINMYE